MLSLFLADEFPEYGSTGPGGHSPVGYHLYVTDVDTTFSQAVEAGATATMPVADMFWGDRHGKLVDPFGHLWSIATHVEDLTPELMQERMAAVFGKVPCESNWRPVPSPGTEPTNHRPRIRCGPPDGLLNHERHERGRRVNRPGFRSWFIDRSVFVHPGAPGRGLVHLARLITAVRT